MYEYKTLISTNINIYKFNLQPDWSTMSIIKQNIHNTCEFPF